MIALLAGLGAISAVGCTFYVAIMRAAKKPYQPVGLSTQEVLVVSRFDIIDIGIEGGDKSCGNG